MDCMKDDWLTHFPLEEANNDLSVYGDPQIYAFSQDNTARLDSNVHIAQAHGSSSSSWLDMSRVETRPPEVLQEARTEVYSYNALVAAPYHRMDSAASVTLTQEHVTQPAYGEGCQDITSRSHSGVDETHNLEKTCLIHRRKGSDNMSFRCLVSGCHRSHSRWPDFLRHYNGAHAVERRVFWCPEEGCARNKTDGNNPFPRKDKLKDHIRQAHGDRHSS